LAGMVIGYRGRFAQRPTLTVKHQRQRR